MPFGLPAIAVPPWLNIKIIAMWAFGLLFLALVWSWNNRGHEVTRLTDFQTGVVQAVTAATVEPGKDGKRKLLKPEQIVTAIGGLQRSYASARTTLTSISTQAAASKRRADAADKQLVDTLIEFKADYAVAKRRIDYLETRPPIKGAPLEVCKVLEDDTNSAWEGWKE